MAARLYQIQPSPMRVAASLQHRIQRGAFHWFMRRITRWSRFSMYPQRVFALVMTFLQLAQFALNAESMSQIMRGSVSARSSLAIHCLQKRISLNQCAAVTAGIRTAAITSGAHHGFSFKSAPAKEKMSAVSLR